ncbi:RHS repeat domain-containing protein [Mariniflexile ostreae]|uniref:RHS repeat domain-containing protein n=1 Tax=Mariniflexile ostreae TaxID=1520892 RepID=A0ABV5FBD5_9FLAO
MSQLARWAHTLSLGDLVWERELNSNGKVLKQKGKANFCPFLYQGQSYDAEVGLAYNRFRYYE